MSEFSNGFKEDLSKVFGHSCDVLNLIRLLRPVPYIQPENNVLQSEIAKESQNYSVHTKSTH